MASSSGCTPMLASADVHSSGKMRRWPTAPRRPCSSSSCDSVPASKNFSISASSASATISMRLSRAAAAASASAAGTSPAAGLLPSPGKRSACMRTRSTTPSNAFSSPIGSCTGTTSRPNASRSEDSERSRLARSRSRRLSTTTHGASISAAVFQTFSVCTSTPATASTTTAAASVMRRAARVSLRKFAMPGVSMKLIFVRFHSANAALEDSVCLRAISSSSKSVTVLPSSTLPSRLTIPASNSAAAASCVLPAPLCPTSATFLISSAAYTFMVLGAVLS